MPRSSCGDINKPTYFKLIIDAIQNSPNEEISV